jgi:hypothetical protein
MTRAPSHDPAGQLDRYLRALFGHTRRPTFVELRWRVPGGMRQQFIPAIELGRAQATIRRVSPRADVYVGVLPRWKRAGGRAAIVGDGRTVWVDLDSDTAVRALEPVEPAPRLIIASSARHRHAYWTLSARVPPAVIERANGRLAWALGGDLASTDAARILGPLSVGRAIRVGVWPARSFADASPTRHGGWRWVG